MYENVKKFLVNALNQRVPLRSQVPNNANGLSYEISHWQEAVAIMLVAEAISQKSDVKMDCERFIREN